MYDHHRRVIERLTARFREDPAVLALLIVGSVARGDAREDSDVDCYLVMTEDGIRERRAAGAPTSAPSFAADDLCDYPGGHAGGSVVDLSFLREVSARGPEPARFAFADAIVAFSRVAQLEPIVASIPRYPENERTRKMIGFASQLPVHFSYMKLAEYSRNPYLLSQTAVELVLFGGRLILAHNRVLYPGRKWFLRELERAPDRPAELLDLADRLLTRPGIRPAAAFCERILGFRDWPQPPEGTMARFRRDREKQWLWNQPPLADS
jgi:hypothetical protein